MVSSPKPAPVKFGRFTLLDRIATGGMAEIFLAKQQGPGRFERSLVIKRILPHLAQDPKFVTMFLDEAALAAHLSHPCIAQVFDFGEEAGSYYIALELVRGPDLRSVIAACQQTGTQIPLPIAVRLMTQVLAALDYAHHAVDEHGQPLHLVHRDVSPQNILVSFDGTVKLVDFGIAKAANASQQTEAGVVKGKYAYLAPEQLQHLPLDGRCDLYAAALVLYELLTLKKALAGEGPQIIAAALNAQIRPISELRGDLPPRLVESLGRALQRDRDARFPDCRSMAAELDTLLIELNASVPAQEIAGFLHTLQGNFGKPLSLVGTGSFAGPEPKPAQLADTAISGAPANTVVDAPEHPQTVVEKVEAPQPEEEPLPELSRSGSGVKWAAAALVLALTGGGIYAAVGSSKPVEPVTAPIAVKPPEPPPVVKPAPVVAPAPMPEVKPAPVAVAAVQPAPPPTPAPVVPAPKPAPHAAPKLARAQVAAPPEVPAPSQPGKLTVGSSPWVEVFVDGKSLGQTPIIEAPLAAGAHTLKVVNAGLGISRSMRVTIASGQVEKVALHLGQGKLRFIVRPWADVTVDGKALGTTPIADAALYEGTHVVELSNPKLGKNVRRSVEVKAGETAELKVDLSKD